MSINEILVWLSSGMALALYIPLITGILRGEIAQSVATWALWVTLDVIALVNIVHKHGNFLLVLLYCMCGTLVTVSLIYKKHFKWSHFESFVLILVCICLVVWGFSGAKWAIISSTVAVCISGIPQIRDSWREPDRATGFIYIGYAIVNGLSFLGGRSWTIEERFYPGMCVLLCLSVAIAALRKNNLAPVRIIKNMP